MKSFDYQNMFANVLFYYNFTSVGFSYNKVWKFFSGYLKIQSIH